MLILLPPSEGKTPPSEGPVLDLAGLTAPELHPHRGRVLDALVRLARGSAPKARATLGLSVRQDEERARDAVLDTAACGPAGGVYTGVLYDALRYPALSAAQRRRLDRRVLVTSGLFGVVSLADQIPAYRLSGDVRLPRLGAVNTWWRPRLASVLDARAADECVLDLRSGTYAGMWRPGQDVAASVAVGRVMLRRPDGALAVVSHHNKATKGRLVRALAAVVREPRTVEEVASAVEAAGFSCRLEQPVGGPARLDVVVDEV